MEHWLNGDLQGKAEVLGEKPGLLPPCLQHFSNELPWD
jgi:hypothetical protein